MYSVQSEVIMCRPDASVNSAGFNFVKCIIYDVINKILPCFYDLTGRQRKELKSLHIR